MSCMIWNVRPTQNQILHFLIKRREKFLACLTNKMWQHKHCVWIQSTNQPRTPLKWFPLNSDAWCYFVKEQKWSRNFQITVALFISNLIQSAKPSISLLSCFWSEVKTIFTFSYYGQCEMKAKWRGGSRRGKRQRKIENSGLLEKGWKALNKFH